MREILFRGKRVDNGEWVEGSLLTDDSLVNPKKWNYHIIGKNERRATERYWVITETVGQYTGLTDKNGKKIFEGDIVKHFNNSDEVSDIGVIYFDTEFMGWRRTTQGRFHRIMIDTYKINPTCIYEVIGNIHDNPDLLKEGADNAGC